MTRQRRGRNVVRSEENGVGATNSLEVKRATKHNGRGRSAPSTVTGQKGHRGAEAPQRSRKDVTRRERARAEGAAKPSAEHLAQRIRKGTAPLMVNAEWIAEYQRLLQKPASIGTLDGVLILFQQILGARIVVPPYSDKIEDLLKQLDDDQAASEEIHKKLPDYVQSFVQTDFELSQQRRLVQRKKLIFQHRLLLAGAAMRILEDVVLRQEVEQGARLSLLIDTCLVIFHNAYFALLPELPQSWAGERTFLIESFKRLAKCLSEVTDAFQVLALSAEASGRPDVAAEFYRKLVFATHSDSHEFMTVLQQCWANMVETGQVREAVLLLMDVYPRVNRSDLDEIKEMVLTTFDLVSEPRQKSGA
jgi:hypothetical protein